MSNEATIGEQQADMGYASYRKSRSSFNSWYNLPKHVKYMIYGVGFTFLACSTIGLMLYLTK